MAFDQSSITDLRLARDGDSLRVRWDSTAPADAAFQVYAGRKLAWRGRGRSCVIPWPDGATRIEVGAVDPGEVNADLSGSLPAPGGTGNRPRVTWLGGTYLDESIEGFKVYRSATAGGAVDYSAPVATVAAYPDGAILDGWGLGGWGEGGWGRAATSYSWQSGPLGNGAWTFAIVPFDSAGNPCGAPTTSTVTIAARPKPPAAAPDGSRLSYAYNPTSHVATLQWTA